jgi:tRNA G18 (ribose-2'-O)-methylase SpoU
MPVETIHELDDPRLEPYRNLKATNLTRWSNRFIAEGLLVVERLLQSDFEVASVLVSRRLERQVLPRVHDECPTYLLEQQLAERLVGYSFHTGVLACGRRRPGPALESVVAAGGSRQLLAVCPHVNDPENVGAIIRLAAGFAVNAVVLGAGCADPFSRRVLRVSMGTAFRVPIVETNDLRTLLTRLRDEHEFELAATVLDPAADQLNLACRSPRMALLFGNEKHGLDPSWVELCARRLSIPMAAGADSLNVAVAAGIFFHHLTRVASQREEASWNVERTV